VGFTSNLSIVLASLAAKSQKVDAAVESAANKGRTIGVQEIQARAPVDTSNLKNSYERCTTISKPSDGVRQIDFTSDVSYQTAQEFGTSRQAGKPHLRPGVAAAEPQIGKILKEELEHV
jgi:HK97 gp10 family phage protein